MSAEGPPLNPEAIFEALEHNDVDYVLVGGLAARLRGASKLTSDVDLCPAWTTENLERLAATLRQLGAELLIDEGSVETVPFPLDARAIDRFELAAWRTSAGDLDVLVGIPRTSLADLSRYSDLIEGASAMELDGRKVQVAALEAIIRSKEVIGRPKDREALPELYALRDQQTMDEELPRSVPRDPEHGPRAAHQPPEPGLER